MPADYQYAVPDGDLDPGSWQTQPLYSKIGWPANDATSVASPQYTSFEWAFDVSLSAVTDPGVYTDHTLLIRAQRATATDTPFRVELRFSSGLYAFREFTLFDAVTTHSFALTGGEIAAISASAYAGGWFLRCFGQVINPGLKQSIVYGAALRVPPLGFDHLDVDVATHQLKVVGPLSGHSMRRHSSGGGYERVAGFEAVNEALILNATTGQIETKM